MVKILKPTRILCALFGLLTRRWAVLLALLKTPLALNKGE
jgi:hypothetical protein